MSNTPIDKHKRHKTNPFIENIYEREIIQRRDGTKMAPTTISVRDKQGKHISPAFVKQKTSKYIDKREFVRITEDGTKILASLKYVEFKILSYILEHINHNELEIELSVMKIKNYYNYSSRNPIYQGISGLLNKNIISRKDTDESIYYINPFYFYKGTIIKEVFDYINTNNISKKQPATKVEIEKLQF